MQHSHWPWTIGTVVLVIGVVGLWQAAGGEIWAPVHPLSALIGCLFNYVIGRASGWDDAKRSP